ncbi:MAG TPA: hypothetical protein VIH82_11780 [Acidimicrobiia bacterium]|jgi:hypothetical protein
MTAATFLEMAHDLMHDGDAKAAFDQDPEGFLAARGFDGLSPDDLTEAVGFVAETLPPETAHALTGPDAGPDALARLAQVEPTVEDPADDADEDDGDDGLGAFDADDGPLDHDESEDDGEDEEDDDEDEDDDDDLGFSSGDDPTQLPDDPGHAGFEPFRDDEVGSGLGVGYENEDVDDASPPEHGDMPDFHF